MEDFKIEYEKWLSSNVLSADEKDELNAISADENEIKERFAASLRFGTAGMRGVLGMGTNRMNRFTVMRATYGLAAYINGLGAESAARGVAIAYDTRKFSTEFAIDCAEVLADCGIKCYLYENVRPVPMCSFAVRSLNAVAGIMITASHNPKEYNGYKVYGEDGAQMSPEATEIVVADILKTDGCLNVPKKSGLTPESIRGKNGETFGLITIVGADLDEKYYAEIEKLRLSPDAVKRAKDIKIVYTPIHGAGYIPVKTVLARTGIPVSIVAEQAVPDANFSTVKVPNPEEPSALSAAVAHAEKIGAHLVIGTDPDCDRMGIAVRNGDGKFILLNGNQTGVLLLDYVLSRNRENGTLPENAAVVKTIVTTKMAEAVAKNYNVTSFDVLTGFKFIGEKIKEWETSGEYTYMFGFEESYGCLSGTHARDKDAVVASMLFAEMACYLKMQNMTVYEKLQSLFEKYGYYVETAFSYTFEGLDGMEKRRRIMDAITKTRPTEIGGLDVEYVCDYQSGIRYNKNGTTEKIALPKTAAMYFGLSRESWICVRPSGTEPKLKIYIATKADSKVASKSLNGAVKKACTELFFR